MGERWENAKKEKEKQIYKGLRRVEPQTTRRFFIAKIKWYGHVCVVLSDKSTFRRKPKTRKEKGFAGVATRGLWNNIEHSTITMI